MDNYVRNDSSGWKFATFNVKSYMYIINFDQTDMKYLTGFSKSHFLKTYFYI